MCRKIFISFFLIFISLSDVMASDFIDVSNSDTNVKMLPSSEDEPELKDNDSEIVLIEKRKIQAFNTAARYMKAKYCLWETDYEKLPNKEKAKRVMYVPEIDNNGYHAFVFMVKDVTCGTGNAGPAFELIHLLTYRSDLYPAKVEDSNQHVGDINRYKQEGNTMVIEHMLLDDSDARLFPTLKYRETFSLPDLTPIQKEFLGKVRRFD
jgi:hypothetical protein